MKASFTYWKDGDHFIGHLDDYPDYETQGESLDDLKEHLLDLENDLSSRANTLPVPQLMVFDSFEEAEAQERQEWMAMPRPERMMLLEQLREQTYPDASSAPQGLQRVLTIVD